MISKLILTNFRLFKGINCIEFDSDSNITIIASNNAEGKTTLLLSIYWCLYGVLPFDNLSLLNVEVANEIEEGDGAQVSVAVTFQFNGQMHELCRKADFVKRSGKLLLEKKYTLFNQSKNDDLFTSMINKLFPYKYAPLFFCGKDPLIE